MVLCIRRATICNKTVLVGRCIFKAFRLEHIGLVPMPGVMIGSVNVQQGQGSFFKCPLFPVEVLARIRRKKGEKRIKPTHFQDKPVKGILQMGLVIFPERVDIDGVPAH